MGQLDTLTRMIMDIKDENYEFFESAGMRFSTPVRGKSDFPLSSDMHAADGKNRDKHRRETLQVPAWNAIAMDELPSALLIPSEMSRTQLLSSVKKKVSKNTQKKVIES